jgi:Cupin
MRWHGERSTSDVVVRYNPRWLFTAIAILQFSLLVVSAPTLATQVEQQSNAQQAKVTTLLTEATEVDRVNFLNASEFVFDFFHPNDPASTTGSGFDGRIVTAKRDTFPPLVGAGVSMSVGFLGPCGLNTPHVHPRGTEFNIAINGTLRVGMLAENGAQFITNTVQAGQATVFPRGSIHFEQNEGCEPIIFVAAFSDEDPGTTSLANQFFSLPPDIIQAALGGVDLQKIIPGIPKNVAFGTEDCLKRCGINASLPTTTTTTGVGRIGLTSSASVLIPRGHLLVVGIVVLLASSVM